MFDVHHNTANVNINIHSIMIGYFAGLKNYIVFLFYPSFLYKKTMMIWGGVIHKSTIK